MREIFTDRNFIESKLLLLIKIILVISLIAFFLPLIVLPFFNHAFADDYICGYNLSNRDFWAYQQFIYTNWGGRFAATFTGSLFVYHNFLYNHYYLHTLLLLAFNFCSLFFLMNVVCKHILKEEYSLFKKIFFAATFLALEICSIPQVSTFLFWFSSAITYQPPVILMQTEIALLIILYNSATRLLQNICTVLLPLIVFIIIGFNELFIIAQLFIFTIAFYFKIYTKSSRIFIIAMMLAFITSSLLLILAPGNEIRMQLITPKRISVGIIATVYHSLEAIWYIFKNPFIWFAGFAVFIHADQTKNLWRDNFFIKKLSRTKWILPAFIFIFLIASIALPVAALKGGIIPDRYINAVIPCMLLLLLSFFFTASLMINFKIPVIRNSIKKITVYSFLIIGLLSNNYIADAYKSIFIAPVYNTILNKREAVLKQAAVSNKISVVKDYDTALSELIKNKYQTSAVTFQQLIQQKPPLLFSVDDLESPYSKDGLKKYFCLDSLIVIQKSQNP